MPPIHKEKSELERLEHGAHNFAFEYGRSIKCVLKGFYNDILMYFLLLKANGIHFKIRVTTNFASEAKCT